MNKINYHHSSKNQPISIQKDVNIAIWIKMIIQLQGCDNFIIQPQAHGPSCLQNSLRRSKDVWHARDVRHVTYDIHPLIFDVRPLIFMPLM